MVTHKAGQNEEHSAYRVPALEKGLDILEYLSEIAVPQSQAELSRALGRSTSELFRMLVCLEQRGYILRDELSNKYQLSLKLYELAHTHSPVEQLLQVAQAPMRQLAQSLRESCHIGLLSDYKLMIVAQEESPEPIRLSVEVGRKFPAIKTASGRLLLAHLPEDELAQFFSSDSDYLSLREEKRQEFRKELAKIRTRRYVIADSGFIASVRDVAVLIGNPKVGACAALAVPLLIPQNHEVNIAKVLTEVQNSAEMITSKLGLSHD